MDAKGRKRKILLTVAITLGGLVLILLAFPLWFPWAWRPLSHRLGVQYSKYERSGYARFVLVDLTITNQTTRFRAEKVDVLVPTLWLGRRLLGDVRITYARVENWRLEFLGQAQRESTAAGPGSAYTSASNVEAVLAKVRGWVPKASFTNGTIGSSVELRRGWPSELRMPLVNWANGILSAEIEEPRSTHRGTLRARLAAAPYEFTFDSDSLHFHSTARVSQAASALLMQSTSDWWSNRVEASAQFGPRGFLPEQASVSAESLRLPAELISLKPFEDLTGSLAFHWQQNQFALHVTTSARPVDTNLGPIEVQVHSTGTLHSVFIEKARVSSPWLRAELTPGTEILPASPFLRQDAALTVTLNLGQQPWFPAAGSLDGQVRLRPAQGRFPTASFSLSGIGTGISNIQTRTLALSGELAWPWLDISQLAIELVDGSRASLNGQLQVEQRLIKGGHFRLDGPFGRQILPAGYSFRAALLDVSFSGPLQMLSHSGHLNVKDFTSPFLKPLQLEADWDGERLVLPHCAILASAGKSVLRIQGSSTVTNTAADLLIQKLTLQRDDRAVMELGAPCQLSFGQMAWETNALPVWHAKLTPLQWRGAEREVKLEGELGWPAYGNLAVTLHSLDPALFADFLALPGVSIRVDELVAKAGWTNGPVDFDLKCSAGINHEGIPISLEASFKGDGKGISLPQLVVTSQTQSVFSAQGNLPLIIIPNDPKHLWAFLPHQELQLHAVTQTNSIFWNEVAALTGVVLTEPRLNLDVAGNFESLHGKVDAQIKEARLPGGPNAGTVARSTSRLIPLNPGTNEIPRFASMELHSLRLTDLKLSLDLDRNRAQVRNFSLLLEGQPVVLTGEAPLGEEFWTGLLHEHSRIDWEKARARIKVANLPNAIPALWLPKVLTGEGTVDLDLALLPGMNMEGQLKLTGASTRPLGSFGIIRDIEATVGFRGQKVDLINLTASIGAAPVSASGHLDLSRGEWFKGGLPPFQISLRGSNVAVARSPDFVVRTDLDVTITKTRTAPVVITGKAELRDSFYLHDLQDLLPGRVNSVNQRPPYFSITTQPWAEWRLDLDLNGKRCLKVNSPLFRGLVSADFKLTGTLKNPIALGNLKVDSGVVELPFANLEATEGLVTLTSGNPYRPQLLFTATSRNAGYDVKMHVTGPADQPVVQFSSSPPLSSEQIVLMLTAGVLPANESSLSANQRAGTVALFFGKNLLSQVGLSGQADRLTVRTGEEISETGHPTYHMEYKLSNRWYLVGEYDRV